MPSWYADDDDDGASRRRRPRRRRSSSSPSPNRDSSPVYRPKGAQPPPLISGALRADPSTARLEYVPGSRLRSTGSAAPDLDALQVPVYRGRPRSVPAPSAGTASTRRRDSSALSPVPRHRSRSPPDKARRALGATFTSSSSGLGVGVLGAIVGGLAAREVSDVATRRREAGRQGGSDKARLVSTLVGAAVGGLGANALERKFEDSEPPRKLCSLATAPVAAWQPPDSPFLHAVHPGEALISMLQCAMIAAGSSSLRRNGVARTAPRLADACRTGEDGEARQPIIMMSTMVTTTCTTARSVEDVVRIPFGPRSEMWQSSSGNGRFACFQEGRRRRRRISRTVRANRWSYFFMVIGIAAVSARPSHILRLTASSVFRGNLEPLEISVLTLKYLQGCFVGFLWKQ